MPVRRPIALTGDSDFAYNPAWADPQDAMYAGPDQSAASVPPLLVGAAVQATTLYESEVRGAPAIAVADINQGQIGDCFLLSSMGEIALLKPGFISNMIHLNANGTETVTLYVGSNGSLPSWNATAFKAVTETVTNVFPSYAVNNGANQDVLAGVKEIWAQVLEKADSMLGGGYNSIANGGSPLVAMEELTGKATSYTSPANLTLQSLTADQIAGDLLVFDTKSSGALTNGLVNNHAYMFNGVTGTGSMAMVHLLNPWGMDQPSAISFSTLAKSFAEIDIGHVS